MLFLLGFPNVLRTCSVRASYVLRTCSVRAPYMLSGIVGFLQERPGPAMRSTRPKPGRQGQRQGEGHGRGQGRGLIQGRGQGQGQGQSCLVWYRETLRVLTSFNINSSKHNMISPLLQRGVENTDCIGYPCHGLDLYCGETRGPTLP